LGLQALDLMPRGFPLLAVHLRGSRASQSPDGAVHDGGRHLQIAR